MTKLSLEGSKITESKTANGNVKPDADGSADRSPPCMKVVQVLPASCPKNLVGETNEAEAWQPVYPIVVDRR